jgi:thiamine kinase-like enzyme
VMLPHDYPWMLDNVRDIAAAIGAAGFDAVACHGDGIASNVMIAGAGQVLLVDWDEAVNADPYWDLGSLFAEAFPFDPPARAALESYAGCCDEALFARCRLYGIVDDLAWATRSMIAATITERVDIEFFKYAQWRFLRCRMSLCDRGFEERLRTI